MVEFESELGKNSFNSNKGQQRKVYSIPDESNEVEYDEQEYKKPAQRVLTEEERKDYIAKRFSNKKKSEERLSAEARERIEFLTGIGRIKKDVEFEGVTFSIQSLKSRELREIAMISLSNKITNIERSFEVRKQVLARSIFQINNNLVEYVIGDDDFQAKLNFIDELDENTVTYLYSKYQEIVEESKVKFGIATKEQAQEVVEEIKK